MLVVPISKKTSYGGNLRCPLFQEAVKMPSQIFFGNKQPPEGGDSLFYQVRVLLWEVCNQYSIFISLKCSILSLVSPENNVTVTYSI